MLRLRFDQLLSERGLTAYRLWKETGLSKNTAYALARPDSDRNRVDLDVLDVAMQAVARASGRPVALGDVLEIVPEREETEVVITQRKGGA